MIERKGLVAGAGAVLSEFMGNALQRAAIGTVRCIADCRERAKENQRPTIGTLE